MAQVADKIIDILRTYIAELERNNIRIKSAFLFGSYARGDYDEWSDIDIALVSDDFEGVRFFDRRKIAGITLDVDSRISPFPFRADGFEEDDLFVKEIIETGVKII